nr:nucleotidyltransferase family protein [Roseofilum casamattae]
MYPMQRDEILALAAQHQDELNAMGVKSLALFGSVARNEATADSDVDFLVEFDDRPIGLFDLSRVRLYLEDILGRKVDMGTVDSLKEYLRDRVLRDRIRVF